MPILGQTLNVCRHREARMLSMFLHLPHYFQPLKPKVCGAIMSIPTYGFDGSLGIHVEGKGMLAMY